MTRALKLRPMSVSRISGGLVSALAPIVFLLSLLPTPGMAVTIPASSSAGPPNLNTGDGLDAEFYNARNDVDSNGEADGIVAANDPTATFIATHIDYPERNVNVTDSSDTNLADFLGDDEPSLSGSRRANLTNSVFVFKGFIQIVDDLDSIDGNDTIDVFFVAGSDDGMRLRIGGVTVTQHPGPRSFAFSGGTASFEEPGLYPIEFLYWERGGNTGVELQSSIPGGPNAGAPAPGLRIVPVDVLSRTLGVGPTCVAGGPYSMECGGEFTSVTLQSQSEEPDGGELVHAWSTDCPGDFDDPSLPNAVLEVDSTSLPLECEVKLEVIDSAGTTDSCSAKVTVADSVAPTLECPTGNIVETQTCQGKLTDLTPNLIASDGCADVGDLAISQSPPAGTVLDLGDHEIQLTAIDPSGNDASCTAIVTVADAFPPDITCPPDITVEPNSGCVYTGPLGDATATDACSDASELVITNDAPAELAVGTNIVTWTAIDPSGNSSSCTHTVTVVDPSPPTITCPADVVLSADSACGFSGSIGMATAVDNCTPTESLIIGNDAPGEFPTGTTVVT